MLISGEFLKGSHYKFQPEEGTDFIKVQIGWSIIVLIIVGIALFFLIRYIRKRLSK